MQMIVVSCVELFPPFYKWSRPLHSIDCIHPWHRAPVEYLTYVQ